MSFLFGRQNKTFKPRKNVNNCDQSAHQYELMKHAQATLGSGNLRLAVRLPEGEDLNEWIAVNIVDFFNQINMLYGTITEFCTEENCPVMSAGPKYEYHWADGHNIKKPIKCSAPKYIDYLMTWAQDQLEDEALFPSKIGVPFPKTFLQIAKTILKRLFRVYAHVYNQHFHQVVELGEEAHLNTSFKHFVLFTQEFGLIESRELVPLQPLIDNLAAKESHSQVQLPQTTTPHHQQSSPSPSGGGGPEGAAQTTAAATATDTDHQSPAVVVIGLNPGPEGSGRPSNDPPHPISSVSEGGDAAATAAEGPEACGPLPGSAHPITATAAAAAAATSSSVATTGGPPLAEGANCGNGGVMGGPPR